MVSHRTAEKSRGQTASSGSTSPASSRSESMTSKSPTTPEGIDFRFLNFSHPLEAKNAQFRRHVRSHVTTKQHEKQRQRVAEQARQTQPEDHHVAASTWSSSHDQRNAASSPNWSETDTSSPEASPTMPSPAVTRINPLELYPEPWHPCLRPVLNHYCDSMATDLPETDAETRQVIRAHFMGLVFTDPAPLHAVMLLASAHLAKVRGAHSHTIDMLQLRGMAIQEVNRAMMDQRPGGGRATSDAMIAAVGKIATFELLFGQKDTFHTHMTGLQRMVSLRGGLQELGLNGMLERILLWIDANAAEITGTPLYFPPAAFASSTAHPPADRRLFVIGIQNGGQ